MYKIDSGRSVRLCKFSKKISRLVSGSARVMIRVKVMIARRGVGRLGSGIQVSVSFQIFALTARSGKCPSGQILTGVRVPVFKKLPRGSIRVRSPPRGSVRVSASFQKNASWVD